MASIETMLITTSDSHDNILINYYKARHKNVPISKNKASMF